MRHALCKDYNYGYRGLLPACPAALKCLEVGAINVMLVLVYADHTTGHTSLLYLPVLHSETHYASAEGCVSSTFPSNRKPFIAIMDGLGACVLSRGHSTPPQYNSATLRFKGSHEINQGLFFFKTQEKKRKSAQTEMKKQRHTMTRTVLGSVKARGYKAGK